MFNQNLKKIFAILFTCFSISNLFSSQKIATTYKTSLTPTDMVEIFLETIGNYATYAYQIWDYEVYTKEDEQNFAWSVYTDDQGYTSRGYRVKEASVYLYLTNGFISLRTFGGQTTINSKQCLKADETENFKQVYASCKNAIINYRVQGEKWLKRYNRNFREDQIIALNKLCGIVGLLGKYNISDYTGWFDDYSFVKDLTDDKIQVLNWQEVKSFESEVSSNNLLKYIYNTFPYSDYTPISAYSNYIEDILKRKGLPLSWHGDTTGLENLFNLNEETFKKLKTVKKDGKLYYILTSNKIKFYRYVDGKILKTDDDLCEVAIADLKANTMNIAYYTDKEGIIYIFQK